MSNVRIDVTAPTAPVMVLNTVSDSGSSNQDGVTNVAAPLVNVSFAREQVSLNSKVNVLLSGQIVGSKFITGNELAAGSAQVAVANLGADGSKALTATLVDLAGNVSGSSPAISLALDRVAPSAPTFSPYQCL